MCEQLTGPCEGCTRIPDPEKCDNKDCKQWRQWFLERWDLIHGYYLKKAPERSVDPCTVCQCPSEMCFPKCSTRTAWEAQQ